MDFPQLVTAAVIGCWSELAMLAWHLRRILDDLKWVTGFERSELVSAMDFDGPWRKG